MIVETSSRARLENLKKQAIENMLKWRALLYSPQSHRIGHISDGELITLIKIEQDTLGILQMAIQYTIVQHLPVKYTFEIEV